MKKGLRPLVRAGVCVTAPPCPNQCPDEEGIKTSVSDRPNKPTTHPVQINALMKKGLRLREPEQRLNSYLHVSKSMP